MMLFKLEQKLHIKQVLGECMGKGVGVEMGTRHCS